jgi:AcrR family transcriptional regulator
MARPSMTEHLAHRAVERTVAGRRAEYEREMARIVDSTFTVIDRTGTLEPSMRVILAEANLSTQAFYRYFASKDELMLALLDEGRRRLLSSLQRRMLRSAGPEDQVRAWVEGVLAQAATGGAASRTRPWVTSEERLAELFPEEQQASVDLLLGLLYEPIRHLRGASHGRGRSGDITDDALRQVAVMVYRLAFATLRSHLAAGTKPSPGETEDLVAFCIGGVTR